MAKLEDGIGIEPIEEPLEKEETFTTSGLHYSKSLDKAGFWEITCDRDDGTGAEVLHFPLDPDDETIEPDGDMIDYKMLELKTQRLQADIEVQITDIKTQMSSISTRIMEKKFGGKLTGIMDVTATTG
jgi:hypothetical protein